MRAAKIVRSNKQQSNVSVMHRLGQNIGIFAITSVPMAVVCIWALSELQTLSSLGNGSGKCWYFENADLFFHLEALAGFGTILWMLRMLLDPVINFLNHTKFRQFIIARRSVFPSAEKVRPAPMVSVAVSPFGKDE
uniref:G-protein coupled receptors family 2 profile 2 domain-containing protein n=1 Tax=Plectus sambesii TaxID=2011161 RepID=A0A914WJS3_9BILA